jgi:hypothetical protein
MARLEPPEHKENLGMEVKKIMISSLLVLGLVGCSTSPTKPSDPDYKLSRQCDKSLDVAYEELSFSEAKGFGGSWEYTKAASLLSAASVQSSFGSYQSCIEKVDSARVYIKESQKTKQQ